jgi:hypothetical protein
VGFRAASHHACGQNSGVLKGFLSAYGEIFPVAGKSKHKKAVQRDCEKPARAPRIASEGLRTLRAARSIG